MIEKTNSLLNEIRSLACGASVCVSLNEYGWGTCRYYASVVGMEVDGVFTTRLNRKEKTCTITRDE